MGLSIAHHSYKPDGLFVLQGLVVHAEEAAIRCQPRKTDILREDMCPELKRNSWEVSVGFESFPEMTAGEFIDDPGPVDMATQIVIICTRGHKDSPLFGARLRLG